MYSSYSIRLWTNAIYNKYTIYHDSSPPTYNSWSTKS